MSRVRCRGSPTFDFQVDCTRIALDPRFKNMEGSIGARLIHVSEQKEARAPKTALWPASGAVYYNFPHAGAAWVRHLAALNKGWCCNQAQQLRCWLRLIYNLAKAMSLVFMPLVPVRLQRRSQCMCVCMCPLLWCVMRAYALEALWCFGDHLAILAPLASFAIKVFKSSGIL